MTIMIGVSTRQYDAALAIDLPKILDMVIALLLAIIGLALSVITGPAVAIGCTVISLVWMIATLIYEIRQE